jgi:hypothetical protein
LLGNATVDCRTNKSLDEKYWTPQAVIAKLKTFCWLTVQSRFRRPALLFPGRGRTASYRNQNNFVQTATEAGGRNCEPSGGVRPASKTKFLRNPAKEPATPAAQASTERQSNEPDPGNSQVSAGCFKLTGQEVRKVKLP